MTALNWQHLWCNETIRWNGRVQSFG